MNRIPPSSGVQNSSVKRTNPEFARCILDWYQKSGRHDLPWIQLRTPYGVWIAEIMLQQTQVATVLPYYMQFMEKFPDLPALANAALDEVMALWAGLGYYARARNLHRTARILVTECSGEFPRTIEGWKNLPGVGRSTAGAILAQAFGLRHPILDGNVRRLLARYFGVEGWPGRSATSQQLWSLAESLLPHARIADYTQALMDFGATVCRVANPVCSSCPLAFNCVAFADRRVSELPTPRPKRPLAQCSFRLLLVQDAKERWFLERRPPEGVWSELWCPPLIETDIESLSYLRSKLGVGVAVVREITEIHHILSHRHLILRPTIFQANHVASCATKSSRWLTMKEIEQLGVPAPVRRMFISLKQSKCH